MKKINKTINDYIKMVNKLNRDEEIYLHGKQILNRTNISENKKKYKRNKKWKNDFLKLN